MVFKSAYRLTTVAACRVCRIDRQRFNEHVANGDYLCAPPTVPGRARLFDETDLIALFIFAREVERGTRPSIAGQLAGMAREGLTESPKSQFVTVGTSLDTGQLIYLQKSRWKIDNEAPVLSLTSYSIGNVRRAIAQGVKEERRIIGTEDEL